MKRTLLLGLIPGNFFLIFFSWRAMFEINGHRYFSFFDDALISMSYGRTFAEGHGLTWYPGAPQVQGFTNPLWTFVFAVLHALDNSITFVGVSYLVLSILIINITAFLTWILLKGCFFGQNNARWIPIVVASTIPFQYSFIYWTLRGMEVGFLGMCLVLMAVCTIKLRQPSGPIRKYWSIWILSAVLGVFTRMDFLLFAIVNLALLRPVGTRSLLVRSIRYQILASAFLVSSALSVILFQKFYFGEFLPNTYTLKMTGFSISERLLRGLAVILKTYSGPLIFILVAIFLIYKRRLENNFLESLKVLSFNSIVAITYTIWVGGDAWEGIGKINRYLSVTQPILICLIAIVVMIVKDQSKLSQFTFHVSVVLSAITFGLGINPFRYSFIKSLPLMTVYIILSLLFLLSTKRHSLRPLSLFLTLVLLTNVIAISLWIKRGGLEFLDREDRNMYLLGAEIDKLLKPDGKVAVLWAGAPIYYSKRAGIDLLGKNDKHVANQNPIRSLNRGVWNSTFYPGHNKWDYDYSIGVLKPDMIAQYWGDISDFKFALWGYRKCAFQNSQYWMLDKSRQVNWNLLRECS